MAARLTTYLVVAIVSATLIAGLIVGAQRDDNEGPVDLIVHNATVYTSDGEGTTAEAVAIRGNQILRVGSNREINRLRRPQTEVIDAEGGTVVPGFNDAHVRLIDGGLQLGRVDLLGAETLADIQARVRVWAEANPGSGWIRGYGWTPASLGDVPPTRQLLDAVVADRPVALTSQDGAAVWVNSEALTLAGITRRTTAPSVRNGAGKLRSDEANGLLTGTAAALVEQVMPRPTREARTNAVKAAAAEAHRVGVTSVQDVGASLGDFELYDELYQAGELDLRIYAALELQEPLDDSLLARLAAIREEFADDPLLKAGAVAIHLDDNLQASVAPDAEPAIEPDTLNRFVRLLDSQGWQVLTHAHGEQAVRMALNAYLHAARSNPPQERPRRHRVEGISMVEPVDMPRFEVLGVIASVQPASADPDNARIALWTRAAGQRATSVSPLASLEDEGARMAFGSGWPAASLNPMFGLHAAVNRTTIDGTPEETWGAAERLGLESAIEAYTANGAYASFDEQRKGSITAGMLADIVVLTTDIFAAPRSRLAGATVAVTIFDGKVVYRRNSRATN